jgi:tetratricopeptide (TPR) repeat protein
MYDNLIANLKELHTKDNHLEIIKLILEIPTANLTYDVIGLLGRAYNNTDEFDKAIACLMSISHQGKNDSVWNYRLGYSYFYKDDFENALAHFEKSYQLGDSESLEYV